MAGDASPAAGDDISTKSDGVSAAGAASLAGSDAFFRKRGRSPAAGEASLFPGDGSPAAGDASLLAENPSPTAGAASPAGRISSPAGSAVAEVPARTGCEGKRLLIAQLGCCAAALGKTESNGNRLISWFMQSIDSVSLSQVFFRRAARPAAILMMERGLQSASACDSEKRRK